MISPHLPKSSAAAPNQSDPLALHRAYYAARDSLHFQEGRLAALQTVLLDLHNKVWSRPSCPAQKPNLVSPPGNDHVSIDHQVLAMNPRKTVRFKSETALSVSQSQAHIPTHLTPYPRPLPMTNISPPTPRSPQADSKPAALANFCPGGSPVTTRPKPQTSDLVFQSLGGTSEDPVSTSSPNPTALSTPLLESAAGIGYLLQLLRDETPILSLSPATETMTENSELSSSPPPLTKP
jgi:hypothetical protein